LYLKTLPYTSPSEDINWEAISYFGFSSSSVLGRSVFEIMKKSSIKHTINDTIKRSNSLKWWLFKNEENMDAN
jgi:hypothetical protein